ncbi:MAG: glycosyltransferase family 10, partial [Bacteroidota bacterium]
VASHDRNGIRGQIADQLAKYGPIAYPGKFRNNARQIPIANNQKKLSFLSDFRFNICPENTNQPGYVTEKLFHAVAAGCIPIYWGSNNAPEPQVFNQRAILFYDDQHPASFSSRLAELHASPETLTTFAQQPRFTPQAATEIYGYYQKLERALTQVLA